jgi:hypothetical protein
MNEEKIPRSNRIKGILIIAVLLLIIILPVCYALIKEHNLKQTEVKAQPVKKDN